MEALGFANWTILTLYAISLCVRVAYASSGEQIPTITFPIPRITFSIPRIAFPIPHNDLSIPNLPFLRDQASIRNDSNSTCLMCRRRPRNGRFDFSGINCRDEAKRLSPMLLEIPRDHATFSMIQLKFQQSWKPANGTTCPRVKYFYRIVETSNSVASYHNYLRTYGNEGFFYHGTRRSCRLGDNGHTTLCASPLCNACSIIRTSFAVTLANPGAFGQGIYTSSASNKSASYSNSPSNGIMFLTKVVLGNIYNVNRFAEVTTCPTGYQSVVFDRMNGQLNETVVYTDDAIRPVYLIVFG